ncbi:S8 family serine peptidase [Azospirillum sp.]|uniref:S8 family serine peptidase n=1 Tax=Azospirillum sp. TaxID=34012 RepID=UPI002D7314C5|nr:S8 family serine peptidase [Azospirillum sp.]HYD69940.1 S8 family serine peptidase [Azospirillum sp.]
MAALPNDPLFSQQWHLLNTGQFGGKPGVDLNVVPVWEDYTGKGVTVGVYDSGVQYTHPDLDGNYDRSLHLSIGGTTHDAFPTDLNNPNNAHGTEVAGIIGAEANNGQGVAGVAYDATLSGVRILEMPSEAATSAAMIQQSRFDVVNHSWGPSQSFNSQFNRLLEGGETIALPVRLSALSGRDGLGTVMVVASGNSREAGDNANYSNFGNERQTVTVAAGTNEGAITDYSTPGAPILVTAPVDRTEVAKAADPAHPHKTTTTDFLGEQGPSPIYVEGFYGGDYTDAMDGTSAAAPMVSGITALMLEANPELGFRDVQEILAATARRFDGPGTFELYRWQENGADGWNGGGMHFSHDYGYGFVDARAAVRLAETWEKQSTAFNETSVTATSPLGLGTAIPEGGAGVSHTFSLSGGVDVEWIQLELHVDHSWWSDLQVTLTSPDGTVSTLIDRPRVSPGYVDSDNPHYSTTGLEGEGYLNFVLTSAAHRGESSAGEWTLTVKDVGPLGAGTFEGAKLTAYGAPDTADDLYVFTDEYAEVGGGKLDRIVLGDTGGTDTLNAAAVSTGSTISLLPGTLSKIDGAWFAIGRDTVIERAYGGDGGDFITGNAADNLLFGGRGTDVLTGGAGADTFLVTRYSDEDMITDFNAAAGDRIGLAPGLTYTVADADFGAEITVGPDASIILAGISARQVEASWFITA